MLGSGLTLSLGTGLRLSLGIGLELSLGKERLCMEGTAPGSDEATGGTTIRNSGNAGFDFGN